MNLSSLTLSLTSTNAPAMKSVLATNTVDGDAAATTLTFEPAITWTEILTQPSGGAAALSLGALTFDPAAGYALAPLGNFYTETFTATADDGETYRVRVVVAGVAEQDAQLQTLTGAFTDPSDAEVTTGALPIGSTITLAVGGAIIAQSPVLDVVAPMVLSDDGDGTFRQLAAPAAMGEILSASATHPHGDAFAEYSLVTGGRYGSVALNPDLSALDTDGGMHVAVAASLDGTRAMLIVRDSAGANAYAYADISAESAFKPASVRFLGSAQSASDDPITSYQTSFGLALLAHIDVTDAATGATTVLWGASSAGWVTLKADIPSVETDMRDALLTAMTDNLSPARALITVADEAPIIFDSAGAATQTAALEVA